MNSYELPVLMKPLLPEDIKQKVITGIKDLAEKLGGTLEIKKDKEGNELIWGKRHLAYPIIVNGSKHEEGYYVFFKLELPAAKVAEFRRGLTLMNDILRFLVIREDQL